MRLVISSPLGKQEFQQRLAGIPGLEWEWVASPKDIAEKAPQAEILILSGLDYTAQLAASLHANPGRLRYIQLLSAGYEGLALHGVPPGVAVANAGAVWSPVVADHAMALVLAMFRRLPDVLAQQAQRDWNYRTIAPQVRAMVGSTMTIVGFGSIAQELATRARSFDMRVTGVTRSGRPHPLADCIYPAGQLKAALAEADVIVIAVPLSAQTSGLIGEQELSACRRDAILVNVARGAVVDSTALRTALCSGALAGAALDVTDPEPLPSGHPLWNTPNLLISPHIGGAAGPRYTQRLVDFVVGNVESFLRREPLTSDITARLS